MPTALVLGCNGQDGSYITDILLEKGYDVFGTVRHSSQANLSRIQHNLSHPKFRLRSADVTDAGSIVKILNESYPEEIYNEADQDHVGYSYSTPAVSIAVTVGGVSNLLEAVKVLDADRRSNMVGGPVKFFQPCSATMFGDAPAPQTENSPFNPLSPYACAKAHAYHLCRYYRQCYGMFISTGIMYNHDSPRRGSGYLLQKICRTAVRITKGSKEKLKLDSATWHSLVDIGYAKDYMLSAWKMLQLAEPTDLILSGRAIQVGVLASLAFTLCGLNYKEHFEIDGMHVPYRPGPKYNLQGNCNLAIEAIDHRSSLSIRDLVELIIGQAQKEEQV